VFAVDRIGRSPIEGSRDALSVTYAAAGARYLPQPFAHLQLQATGKEEIGRTRQAQGGAPGKEVEMDRRMLAIGAATIALAAVGCGSDDASDRAAQGSDVEVEATATPNTPKNGLHGASDAAQRGMGEARDKAAAQFGGRAACGASLANCTVNGSGKVVTP
jgi:hypothetical protein